MAKFSFRKMWRRFEVTRAASALNGAYEDLKDAKEQLADAQDHVVDMQIDVDQADKKLRIAMIQDNDEFCTRMAAEAVGYEHEHLKWDAALLSLVPENVDEYYAFSPMTDPADAYHLEHELQLHVEYKVITKTKLCITLSDSKGLSCSAVANPRLGDTSRERMREATTLAAMMAIEYGACIPKRPEPAVNMGVEPTKQWPR